MTAAAEGDVEVSAQKRVPSFLFCRRGTIFQALAASRFKAAPPFPCWVLSRTLPLFPSQFPESVVLVSRLDSKSLLLLCKSLLHLTERPAKSNVLETSRPERSLEYAGTRFTICPSRACWCFAHDANSYCTAVCRRYDVRDEYARRISRLRERFRPHRALLLLLFQLVQHAKPDVDPHSRARLPRSSRL